MNISQNGVDRIKEDEGLREKMADGRVAAYQQSYQDKKTGKVHLDIPTIGYGCTKGVRMGMVWTLEECEGGLRRELTDIEHDVNRLVKIPITQNMYDALVGFGYNVGTGKDGLGGSTLLKKLNAGDKAGAAQEFARWNKTGGVVVQGLINRRAREAALFSRPMPEEVHKAAAMPQTVDAPKEPMNPAAKNTLITVGATTGGTIAVKTAEYLVAPPPPVVTDTVANITLWQSMGASVVKIGTTAWSSPEAMVVIAVIGTISLFAPRIMGWIKR